MEIYPNKSPELMKAKNDIRKFLRLHKLDPRKDYSNHSTLGKEFRELLFKLNKERDKVTIKYPQTDIKNLKKYVTMKEKKKKIKEAEKAVVKEVKVTKEPKEKKAKKAVKKSSKYDYPLVDGREMTSDEKKKYRAEQRKLNKGDEPKEKKPKKESKEKAPKEEKVDKKKKKPLKTKDTNKKKSKKVKEED